MLKSFYRNYQSKLIDFSSKNVRKSFIDYFVKEKDHVYIPSSSVKTVSDASVPFVNAGMNQVRFFTRESKIGTYKKFGQPKNNF